MIHIPKPNFLLSKLAIEAHFIDLYFIKNIVLTIAFFVVLIHFLHSFFLNDSAPYLSQSQAPAQPPESQHFASINSSFFQQNSHFYKPNICIFFANIFRNFGSNIAVHYLPLCLPFLCQFFCNSDTLK